MIINIVTMLQKYDPIFAYRKKIESKYINVARLIHHHECFFRIYKVWGCFFCNIVTSLIIRHLALFVN